VVKRLGEAAMHLGKSMMSGQVMSAFAHAYTFMDVAGDVIMAWMLLWRACTAAELLAKGTRKKDEKFLEGQIKSAQHLINNFLPLTRVKHRHHHERLRRGGGDRGRKFRRKVSLNRSVPEVREGFRFF
jgi:hypothetical protein